MSYEPLDADFEVAVRYMRSRRFEHFGRQSDISKLKESLRISWTAELYRNAIQEKFHPTSSVHIEVFRQRICNL